MEEGRSKELAALVAGCSPAVLQEVKRLAVGTIVFCALK